jgi:hypothetical protein
VYKNRVTYPVKLLHKGSSRLEKLKLDMVFQIPLDYMHLVNLGIVKKLLTIWVDGPPPFKLGSVQIKLISDRLHGKK